MFSETPCLSLGAGLDNDIDHVHLAGLITSVLSLATGKRVLHHAGLSGMQQLPKVQ